MCIYICAPTSLAAFFPCFYCARTIFANIVDWLSCFSQDKFLPFVDMFQKESIKVDVCKLIMEAFVK